MATYGKGYIKTASGIFKILEVIFCIVVVALISDYTSNHDVHELYSALLGAGVTGLVLPLLIIILSCAVGQDLDAVLQWQCIAHFGMAVWFIVCGILLALKKWGNRSLTIAIMGIVSGVVYLIDAFLSYSDNKPF